LYDVLVFFLITLTNEVLRLIDLIGFDLIWFVSVLSIVIAGFVKVFSSFFPQSLPFPHMPFIHPSYYIRRFPFPPHAYILIM